MSVTERCRLLAQSRDADRSDECPLSGAKRTWRTWSEVRCGEATQAESSTIRAVSECIDRWRIRTHCCVEAPKNSLLPSLRQFSAVDRSVVNETDGDWATGYSAAHALAKAQRRATRERRIHGVAIDIAHLGGCFVA